MLECEMMVDDVFVGNPLHSSKKRVQNKDYFDDDNDDEDYSLFPLHQRSSPSSSSTLATSSNVNASAHIDGDDDIDPLDAFMAQNNQQILIEKTQDNPLPEIVSGQDDDIDEYPMTTYSDNIHEDVEYDSDEIPKNSHKDKSKIQPLVQVDHSQITYPSFRKSFYSPSQSVRNFISISVV